MRALTGTLQEVCDAAWEAAVTAQTESYLQRIHQPYSSTSLLLAKKEEDLQVDCVCLVQVARAALQEIGGAVR